jgi:hypothetical protein
LNEREKSDEEIARIVDARINELIEMGLIKGKGG